MHRLAAVLTFCVLAPAFLSAQDTLVGYSVTLRAAMAVDAPEAIAGELAAGYGGTLAEPVRGLTFAMRLSASRARVLARDPRVESMVVQATTVPAIAEAMSWGTGVDYTYDGSGNVRKIGTDPFVYDAVNRLVQADTNGVRRNYEYDGFGNRTRCRQSEGTPTEGECQHAFTIKPANNRVEGVTYDAAGNVKVFGGHTYTYDALNMQTRDDGAIVREFLYTANDERIAVYTVGQSWRWTIRDTSGKVLREFASYDGPNGLGTASWQWTKDYIWRDGLLLASRQMAGSSVTTYHDHLDHLGSPRRVTDASDRIVGVHDYIPFGPEASGGQQEPSLSLLKYTAHERDLLGSESWDTLDYMHALYYNPTLGRFLSVDPGRDWDPRQPQSWNMYAYVRNNPINRVDPTGRCGEDASFVGPRIPCAAQSEAKPKPQRNNSPAQGQEPGTKEIPDGKGGKTVRTYGPDGRAVTDVDYGHGHDGAPDPHVHDWDWDKKNPRQDWRAPNPGEIPDPAKSTSIGQRRPDLQTIIGATILSIGGTAMMIMTGGAMSLQPNAAGVVIVPRRGIAPLPANQWDCPPTSPYCT